MTSDTPNTTQPDNWQFRNVQKHPLLSLVGAVFVLLSLGSLPFLCWPRTDTTGAEKAVGAAEAAGQFGDSFGVLNAVVSGLAFAVLAWTLHLQQEQMKLQREATEDSRNQAFLTAYLGALSTIVDLHEKSIERASGEDNRLESIIRKQKNNPLKTEVAELVRRLRPVVESHLSATPPREAAGLIQNRDALKSIAAAAEQISSDWSNCDACNQKMVDRFLELLRITLEQISDRKLACNGDDYLVNGVPTESNDTAKTPSGLIQEFITMMSNDPKESKIEEIRQKSSDKLAELQRTINSA